MAWRIDRRENLNWCAKAPIVLVPALLPRFTPRKMNNLTVAKYFHRSQQQCRTAARAMNSAILHTALKCNSPFTTTRAFSTAIRLSAIGPESPKFIQIFQPPQQHALIVPVIRGTLPPPRDIFASRGGKDKTTRKYLQETIPESTKTTQFARDEQAAWKRRMAETRRRSLREGLQALNERRGNRAALLKRRSEEKMHRRDAVVYGAPRRDEVLTSSTVKEAMRWFQHGPLPDPDREARIAAKVARVQAQEAQREAARRDALHSLYMHARSFITTEAQLDAKINELFVEFPFEGPATKGKVEKHNNIWDAKSAPPTVEDFLSADGKGWGYTGFESQRKFLASTGKRVQRIAEELTGGKMDE